MRARGAARTRTPHERFERMIRLQNERTRFEKVALVNIHMHTHTHTHTHSQTHIHTHTHTHKVNAIVSFYDKFWGELFFENFYELICQEARRYRRIHRLCEKIYGIIF